MSFFAIVMQSIRKKSICEGKIIALVCLNYKEMILAKVFVLLKNKKIQRMSLKFFDGIKPHPVNTPPIKLSKTPTFIGQKGYGKFRLTGLR